MIVELQEAIYYELVNLTELTGRVSGVFDNVLQETEFPYVAIGEDVIIGWDTDEARGMEAQVEVHIWSRYRGRKEVRELMDIIYRHLHRRKISIVGYHTVTCEFERANTIMDSDMITRHGVMDFRVKYHEEVS